MHTLVSMATFRHITLRIVTERPTEFIDLTAQLEALVAEA